VNLSINSNVGEASLTVNHDVEGNLSRGPLRCGSDVLLLDGATGTELDRRGVDISLPLWSARAIEEAPDVLKLVHQKYLDAGAAGITTNTFRTHQRSLAKAGVGDKAQALTSKAVAIARAACDEVNSDGLVFGSVAPLEDCYSPALAPDADACRREHGQLIDHLVTAGVDFVFLETMCSAVESRAAMEAAQHHASGQWGISFCLSSDSPGDLLDGTPVRALGPILFESQFIGINCVSADILADQVRHVREALGEDVVIAAYGNVGFADEHGSWVSTDAIEPHRYATYAMDWIEAGASIVGGCCGTTPETIRAIRERLNLR